MNALERASYFRDQAGNWTMVMPLMTLPGPTGIPEAAERVMDQLAERFASAPVGARSTVQQWLMERPWECGNLKPFERQELQHPLSDRLVRKPLVVPKDGRSLGEWEALQGKDIPPFSRAVSGEFDEYLDALMAVYTAVSGKVPAFRTGDVGTRHDRRGVRVQYPHAKTVPGQVRRIHAYQKRMRHRPGISAVVSLVALLNTHPFSDGNGRFARSVFNWILRGHAGKDVYLPIKEVALLSYSGYLLRVREAEHFHEWQPLAEFLLMISRKLFRSR